MHDLRYAVRSLARTPSVTLVAIATLALGVGANTAIFSVVYGVLIAPLPYPHADRVVMPWRHNPKLGVSISATSADLDRWKGASSIEAQTSYLTESLVLTSGQEPEAMRVGRVDPGLLEFTGSRPVLGRAFTPGDAASDSAARVVLISDAIWRGRFGAARDVVGKRMILTDQSFEIVGVLPPSFQLPAGTVDMLAPMPAPADKAKVLPNAIMRLKPGVNVAAAEAELASVGVDPFGSAVSEWVVRLERPADRSGSTFRRALLVLFGAVGFVLLIACANVANLMLARHSARSREIAIRLALGAGRGRIICHLLTESFCLALVGGAAGLLLGGWSLRAIIALRPVEMTELERVGVSGEVFAFGLGLSLVTGLLFGILPAFAGTKTGPADGLRHGARSRGSAKTAFVRRALSVAEVALALVLLSGAGLLIRSYVRLQQADLGFNPARVLAVRISLPESRYPTPQTRSAFASEFAALVRRLPGVRYSTIASGVPPRGGITFGRLEIEGRPLPGAGGATTFGGGWITPGYFEALGIPIQGRAFGDRDLESPDGPIIVNEAVSRQYFPGESPLGHRMRLNAKAPWRTIVGVAGNVRAMGGIDSLQLYHPMGPESMFFDATLLVATTGDPRSLMAAVKGQAWSLDPRLPLGTIDTLAERVSESRARPRFNLALLSAFASIGLLLAALGVYGVISYSVGLRRQEIGVRMALGATASNIRRAVLGEAMLLAGVGTAIGLAGSLALTRVLTSLLFEVSAVDPWTFTAVALVLSAASLAAAWLPARRAMRIDPMVALRAE